MDKKELAARAERRRVWAQTDSPNRLAEEIAYVWMQLAHDWDPRVQERVPSHVPVGPEFKTWIDDYLKRSRFRWREFDGASDLAAKEVAKVIDMAGNRLVGRDFPNPLDGIETEKGEGYVVKAASVKNADTAYGPVSYPDRHRNQYDSPFEWTRYSPDNPGTMLQRIGDGIYQDPVSGQVYEYEKGMQNQTNLGWNDVWPQPGFLSRNQQTWEDREETLKSYGEPDSVEKSTEKRDVPAGGESSNVHKRDTRGESLRRKTQADKFVIEDKIFGPPQVKSRYCPDHSGVMLYRVADDVYQCPLDRAVYDFAQGFTTQDGEENHGGSVAEMTPDRADYYQSPHPFLQVGLLKGINKGAMRLKIDPSEQKKQERREKQVSGLREYQDEANKWLTMPLEEAKTQFKAVVEKVLASQPKVLARAILGIDKARSTENLLKHFYDLLLKHEGQGVIRGSNLKRKAYANLESRFVFDLSHALTNNNDSSKRVLQLVIEGVMKRGKALGEAIRDAYTVIDQESVVPSAPAKPLEEKPEIEVDEAEVKL